jgi:hypothetical protein
MEMMKKLERVALTLSLCFLLCCVAAIAAAQAPPLFKPVPASKIDQAQKDKASKVAATTLDNWFKGKFAPLSDDFTSLMKEKLGPAAQKQATEGVKSVFGDFQSMKFVEAEASPAMAGIVVYRFKGKFSKTSESPEIRVVVNKQGKVAGLSVKPWQDKIQ